MMKCTCLLHMEFWMSSKGLIIRGIFTYIMNERFRYLRLLVQSIILDIPMNGSLHDRRGGVCWEMLKIRSYMPHSQELAIKFVLLSNGLRNWAYASLLPAHGRSYSLWVLSIILYCSALSIGICAPNIALNCVL
jgi:hypothetical protein